MPNCLGIYTENNIIKYAKLDSDKTGTSFKLASYGVRFSENTKETIEEIIAETNSTNDELATNILSERYELIDVFSRLSKKDIKELVASEFANLCDTKGLISSVKEMKFKLSKNTGDADKYKAICVSTDKSELANVFKDFAEKKITSLAPLGVSITNILANKGIDDQVAIINIEDETVVTIIERGEIAAILSYPVGMKDVLPKLAEKYNSYSKAYEACKGVSAYIEDVYALEDSDREILDLVIPMLYDLRSRIEKDIKPHLPLINRIYLTGTGAIINNLDLYFHELFTDKTCQLLVPYFLPKDSNNLKDIMEVNSAIALAFNGLGFNDQETEFISGSAATMMNTELLQKKFEEIKGKIFSFAKSNATLKNLTSKIPSIGGGKALGNKKEDGKKKKIDIEFNDEIVENTSEDSMQPNIDIGNGEVMEQEEKTKGLTATEAWLARTAGAVLLTFALYSGAAYYTNEVITEKSDEVNKNKADVNSWIATAKSDTSKIEAETGKYKVWQGELQELLGKVTTRTANFSIPNFMSKLMFVIPENVQVTSIAVQDGWVEMDAESGQYAQLGYFVSKLKLEKVLTDVDMSVVSMDGNIKIKVSGAMP